VKLIQSLLTRDFKGGLAMETKVLHSKMKAPMEKIAPAEKTPLKKKRVLVIEDEYSASKFLSLRLENLGFAVSTAFDGMTGLKEATETIPDLIILDLMIPQLPGEEVCKALRESFDEKLVQIPIIMLTGKDSMVDKILGKVIGADAYLTKPYEFSDLLEVIKKILPNS
jgi:DNA-binding response OmpR family regulator